MNLPAERHKGDDGMEGTVVGISLLILVVAAVLYLFYRLVKAAVKSGVREVLAELEREKNAPPENEEKQP